MGDIKPKPISPSDFPVYEDLLKDPEEAFKNDQFNRLANMEPPKNWLKLHPSSSDDKKILYLPVEKVEFLLTKMFGEWSVEVIDYKPLFNAVSVHVRLHLVHPFTKKSFHIDGVGAVQVQTKKGASAADLSQINHEAVMKALPAAKSYAIKDAADHLGKLFGRDLNRKETIGSEVYAKNAAKWAKTDSEDETIRTMLQDCKTLSDVKRFQEKNPNVDMRYIEERNDQIREVTDL